MKLLATLMVAALSLSFPNDTIEPANNECVTSETIAYDEPSAISPLSVASHPEINGFSRVFSFDEPMLHVFQYNNKKMGYLYMDLDLYTTPFTENSMLLIVHTQTSATSGYVANSTGQSGYYNRVDLMKLGIKVRVPRITNTQNGHHTGSVKPIDYWPKSGQDSPSGTVSHSSSFGVTGNFNADIEAGVDAGGLFIKGGAGPSVSLSFGSSTTITTADPKYSSQKSANGINEFSYFIEYKKFGQITYTMNTYSLYEIGYNVSGFNKNGFVVQYETEMKVGENVGIWLFEKTYTDKFTFEERWNLGYNPEYIDYYA